MRGRKRATAPATWKLAPAAVVVIGPCHQLQRIAVIRAEAENGAKVMREFEAQLTELMGQISAAATTISGATSARVRVIRKRPR